MTAAHRLAARAPHHIPTKTNFQKQSQLFVTEFYLNSIIASRITEFRLRAAMAKKGRKVQNNKIKKAESKALEATKPPDQTKGIEPLHELRSLPVLHIPFHPTNPDADHYGHYYSDQLYKNATLSTFRSCQSDFRDMDSDCVFASAFVLADIIPGTCLKKWGK